MDQRTGETPSRRDRRERRIAERRAERDRARTRARWPVWRSPTALVTIGAAAIGLVALVMVIALSGNGSGAAAPSTAALVRPASAIPAGLANDRTLGRADAPVTIDVWTDFQCPYCARFVEQIQPQLITDFIVPGTVRLVAKDLSFLGAGHTPDESNDAAVAARCAARQGRFWEYHDYLFWNQLGENVGSFTRARLLAMAQAVGLDTSAFQACTSDGTVAAAVAAETAAGAAKGVTSTPTLFVNGRMIVGVPSYDSLASAIRAAAAAAGSTAASPSPPTARPSPIASSAP
ncbi:MAG: DsbA family protein [Candidatus Limnocylindrales bacterium]